MVAVAAVVDSVSAMASDTSANRICEQNTDIMAHHFCVYCSNATFLINFKTCVEGIQEKEHKRMKQVT
jgi:hypothetical protein